MKGGKTVKLFLNYYYNRTDKVKKQIFWKSYTLYAGGGISGQNKIFRMVLGICQNAQDMHNLLDYDILKVIFIYFENSMDFLI